MSEILLLNKIAACGTDIFDKEKYTLGNDIADPDAILVRSASMHEMEFGPSLEAIARAGAGVNNIPIDRCSKEGIVVFNTPGANANAVKELTVAALLIAARDVVGGSKWADSLKGEADVASIRSMVRVAREGGNVALFPEGNRTWADFPFYIDPAICSLIRLLKLPLLLYHFEGGYGVDPRWGKKRRKGAFRAYVYREMSVEEIASMSDEALYRTVIDALTVADGKSGNTYASPDRAEYLERLLFICPMCGKVSTLRSEGAHLACTYCGLDVTYGEDLSLSSETKGFPFSDLKEWYAYQLSCIREMKPEAGQTIYRDADAVLYDKTGEKRILVAEGESTLTAEALRVGEFEIPLSKIHSVSVVGGRKLVFHTKEKFYILTGNERFNAIKYAFTFSVLPTEIKNEKYYGLEI